MTVGKHMTSSGFWTVAFALSVFILFFIGSISLRHIQSLSASQESVTNSHKVRIDLERLFSEIKDAETAQRGYIITRDIHFLEHYNYAHVRINKSLIDIQSMTQNNGQRQRELNDLSILVNKRFRLLRDNLLASNRMSRDSEEFRLLMLEEKQVMDTIRNLVDTIIRKEALILERQEKNHGDEAFITPLMSLMLVVFSVIVFVFSFLRINQNLKQMKLLNHKLQITNETFVDAEKIGDISHWQLDTESEKFWFSENKYRVMGYKPQSFEPSIESFLRIVHPADRRKVRSSFRQAEFNKTYTIYFRITRPDKKIRYIKSVSKRTHDSDEREIIIGIDADVTIAHKNTIKLERKNLLLKNSNDELISFNHIVSHDLQEPLRKIQMFISRIDKSDIDQLSESAQSYISRIHLAANRSQQLIDDLLIYSRVSRMDKKPEIIDLNVILEDAKSDLSQRIEEKNAIITSQTLPTAKVVAHQIQHLFINLLSNSLKYHKANTAPQISIQYELIKGSEIMDFKSPPLKMFHLIIFSDNGIGFDSSYAERIFVLFHRLHDKDDYSGTGIGLAICKKMVQNHNGFIFASSGANQGATFKIFLPA